ncbi:MAG: hypothetical protein QXH37_08920 [Candidatus Bathyarchaeia archaeon]
MDKRMKINEAIAKNNTFLSLGLRSRGRKAVIGSKNVRNNQTGFWEKEMFTK